MENIVIVTLKGKGFSCPRDLGLPTYIPVATLTSILFKTLDIAREVDANRISYLIENADKIIRPQQTLAEAGVVMGDILIVQNFTPEKISEPSLIACSGEVFKLRASTILIGRSDEKRGIFTDVDLTILDKELSVSRRHAQINCEAENYWLKDLKSANGTWINGEQIKPDLPRLLQHGDSVRFGDIEFTFFIGKNSGRGMNARKSRI